MWETSWIAQYSPLFLPIALLFLGFLVNLRLAQVAARQEKSARQAAERFKLTQESRAAEARRFNALVEVRTDSYAKAFARLKATALYFPVADEEASGEKGTPILSREACRKMGQDLSEWYFGAGGLLMSKPARDAYFALSEWLGKAADSDVELASRLYGVGSSALTIPRVKTLRTDAGMDPESGPADDWSFGPSQSADNEGARIKDYLAIQFFASRFRTALTEDIKSREPPGGDRE